MARSRRRWTVVPETSSVGFVGTQQGTKFNGRFQKFTATINLDAADPTKGSIAGTVQLDSVNTRDSDRDASLLDKDWFNAKQYPEAKFESQKIEKTADGYVANGNLTLKGTTKPAAMKFTIGWLGRHGEVRRHADDQPFRLQRRRRLERHELGRAGRRRRRQAGPQEVTDS